MGALRGKWITSSTGQGITFKERKEQKCRAPTGILMEPDASNPTWWAGGEAHTVGPPGSTTLENKELRRGPAEQVETQMKPLW